MRSLPTVIAAFATLSLASPAQEFKSPRLDAVTSWIGNSYGGAEKWMQHNIQALTVLPDGTVFTNVYWEEGGGNTGEYREGKLIRYARHTHGWGYEGGAAVAANSRYVYLGAEVSFMNMDGFKTDSGGTVTGPDTWAPKGRKWLGISRRARADISQGASFEGGKGGQGDTLKGAFLPVAEVPDTTKPDGAIPGICADEKRLYVADPHAGEMKVYDAETMQPVANWKINRAGPLALDRAGVLWMLERKTEIAPARLVRFNAKGEEQTPAFGFAPEVVPVAFCLAGDGRVLVADDGPAQQIRIYTAKSGSFVEVSVFGERGGIASGVPGAFGDRKLNHVTALGMDENNNLYASQNGSSNGAGTVLESYDPAGRLNWRLFGLTFVDMGDVDASSDTDFFTKEHHFRLDHMKSAGNEWSYAGYTIGRFKYPQDPRLHLWSDRAAVRRIGGQRVLFVNAMMDGLLQVYRFAPDTDGEVAIPSGLFAKDHFKGKEDWPPAKENDAWPPNQPERGEWIWRDANGNGAFDAGEFATNGGGAAPGGWGWWVDRTGGVWFTAEKNGMRHFPVQGLDAHGNPQWDFAKAQTFPPPEGFEQVRCLRYDDASDILYLGGTTVEHKNQHWKPMGPVLARYDGWLHGSRRPRWRVTLPYARGSSGHESCEPMSFDVAGDFIFVPYTGASGKDGVKTGRVEIVRASDGSAAGHVEPGSGVGGIGLQDFAESLSAHRRAHGEYIVFMEDDWKSKVLMYRIRALK